MQEFSGSQNKWITAFYFFQHQTSKMWQIMTRLIEMISTWSFKISTTDILLVFSHSFLESSPCKTHILTFWIFLAVWFFTSPVIYAILCFTINSIFNLVSISCYQTSHLACGGEGIGHIMCQFLGPEIVIMGQHSFWAQKLTLWVSFWAQKFEHFFQFMVQKVLTRILANKKRKK